MTKPTVSISPETVTATEGETFTWNISLDQPAPEGGLPLFLSITDNNDPAPGDVNYFVEGSNNIAEFEFTTEESISQIYAFGDSYSDDGLSLEISTDAVEADIPDSFVLPADPELGLYDPEGETEATLVSEVVVDGVAEGEENFTTVLTEGEDYNVNPESDRIITNLIDTDSVADLPSPVFGTTEADVIEVDSNGQLVFAGNSDDLIDAYLSSGENRIYGGNGNDTVVLGENDRVFGGDGSDRFFATSGGNNTITGDAGADQFWIATASIPNSTNIITDFTLGEDVIGIAGLNISFDDLTITQTDADTVIAVNSSDLAVLSNVSVDSLDGNNFAFG